MKNWVRAGICFSTGFLLLAFATTCMSKKHGSTFLNGAGIFASVFGLITAMWATEMCVKHLIGDGAPEMCTRNQVMINPELPPQHGTGSDSLEFTFASRSESMFNFLIVVGRAAINVTMSVVAAFSLPDRDPDKIGNESRWIVAAVETPMLLFQTFLLVSYFLMGLKKIEFAESEGKSKFPKMLDAEVRLRMVSGFSALQFLPAASPTRVYAGFNALKEKVGWGFAILLSPLKFGIPGVLAVVAVVAKIQASSFICTKIVNDWQTAEWIRLLALINNLASLTDTDTLKTFATLEFINPFNGESALLQWRIDLANALIEWQGPFWAFVYLSTLKFDHVKKLLNMRARLRADAYFQLA